MSRGIIYYTDSRLPDRLAEPVRATIAAAGLPIVFTNHTRYDLYAHHYLPAVVPDAVTSTFLKAYLPNFCAQCQLVIAPSAGTAHVMRTLGVQTPIRVIPNGVDLAPFVAPPPISRAEAGLPEAAVVLMYTGRLSPEKNLVFLLRAFFGVNLYFNNIIFLVMTCESILS